jgi:hypothetical protein
MSGHDDDERTFAVSPVAAPRGHLKAENPIRIRQQSRGRARAGRVHPRGADRTAAQSRAESRSRRGSRICARRRRRTRRRREDGWQDGPGRQCDAMRCDASPGRMWVVTLREFTVISKSQTQARQRDAPSRRDAQFWHRNPLSAIFGVAAAAAVPAPGPRHRASRENSHTHADRWQLRCTLHPSVGGEKLRNPRLCACCDPEIHAKSACVCVRGRCLASPPALAAVLPLSGPRKNAKAALG